jgi:hypothetical protein
VYWGKESNWIHSALRPPIGLLWQPRLIMMIEKLVEWWLTREAEVLAENLPQCRSVHHKPHMLCPDTNPGRRGGKSATTARPFSVINYVSENLFWLLTISTISHPLPLRPSPSHPLPWGSKKRSLFSLITRFRKLSLLIHFYTSCGRYKFNNFLFCEEGGV